jgi:hypothetical protein
MQTSEFDKLWAVVVGGLPAQVRTALDEFWNSGPAVDPETGEKHPAPFLILGKGWTAQAEASDVSSLANCGDGRCMIFDADFVQEAPAEVVSTLMAHELAHVYEDVAGRSEGQSEPKVEKAVRRRMRKWGYCDEEIEMWLAAKGCSRSDPISLFYAHRFEKLRRAPPPNANFSAISDVLVSRGQHGLAKQAIAMAMAPAPAL